MVGFGRYNDKVDDALLHDDQSQSAINLKNLDDQGLKFERAITDYLMLFNQKKADIYSEN